MEGQLREGTPRRHEPPLCRQEPPRFAMQTEPPPCGPSLRYAVNEPLPNSTAFFKSSFLWLMTNFNNFFDVVA